MITHMSIRTSLTALALIAVCVFPMVATAIDTVPVPAGYEGKIITLRAVVFMVQDIMNAGIILATLAVVAMIVYSGFQMATSRGDEAKYKKGRETLLYAIYGALVVFGVGLIVNTIANVAYDPTDVFR